MTTTRLDATALRQATEGCRWIGRGDALVEVHPSIGSTNQRLAELAAAGAPVGSLVLAERQEAGRGRRGRRWASPPGGLYLSLLLGWEPAPRPGPPPTLLAGLALAEAVEDTCGLRCPLKWPNDLQLPGEPSRKLAGILGELAHQDGTARLVLGVGINLGTRAADLPAELREQAGSLADAGAEPEPHVLLGAFLRRFERRSAQAPHEPTALLAAIAARMPLIGRELRARSGTRRIEGRALGLGPGGELRLRDAAGREHLLVAGEVQEVRPT